MSNGEDFWFTDEIAQQHWRPARREWSVRLAYFYFGHLLGDCRRGRLFDLHYMPRTAHIDSAG
jgi:hypothetical protein